MSGIRESLGSTDQKTEVIDFSQYFRIIMRRKWSILFFSMLVTLIVALFLMTLKPIYKATSTVLIENKQSKVLSIEDVYGLNTGGKEYFLTQFEIIKSRELAVRVIERLDSVSYTHLTLPTKA